VTRIKELENRLWDVADFVKPPQVGHWGCHRGQESFTDDKLDSSLAASVCAKEVCR
jgi:hypothetical protein